MSVVEIAAILFALLPLLAAMWMAAEIWRSMK